MQAARKVIVQLRSQERLKKLQALVSDIKAGKSPKEMLRKHNLVSNNMVVIPWLNFPLSYNNIVIHVIAKRSDEGSDIEELLAEAPPFNPDVVDLSLFPEYEEGEERDDEGNLVINGVALKKVDVEPLVLEDYIKEEWPRLEPKV